LVGFVVGLVDRERILDGSRVRPKDIILGLPSTGLHTNGYSLARRVFYEQLGLAPGDRIPGSTSKASVTEQLLAIHASYLRAVAPLLEHPGLHALAHITGGGLTDNIPRVLPPKTRAQIKAGSWEVPEIFRLLQEHGAIDTEEMFRVFNMGIGMCVIVAPESVGEVMASLKAAGTKASPIGTVQKGGSGVVYDLGGHNT
ncbi:MAG: phosphoribosylformylglycinamidine cyclo-ligase, partial [Acidimicrobiales bacterium]|nr:phosphoribosylformylglycinamidine cyclo-ligase [Acidimicrobiales bacterium]